jgi:ABC-2 type transport system permease protein
VVIALAKLIYNEIIKMVRKRRFLAVVLILAVLIPIFTYAQYVSVQSTIKQIGTSDWRAILQQQIVDRENQLTSSRIPEEWKKWTRLTIDQEKYYLKNNINPTAPGAPTFVRKFVEEAVALFLPLIVVILAADLVSSEYANGTMKLLLTRPVARWKILLSKYLALIFSISLVMVVTIILSYTISGLIFGYRGWDLPVLTGFVQQGNQLLTNQVHLIPQWEYIVFAYGLAWFASIVVGTLSFMVSVLVQNTASSMGVMLAAVISGSLLTQLAPTWESLRYFVFINLRLTDYLAGKPILISGMSLPFSLTVLSVWAVVGIIVAFVAFTRKDVLS